MLGLNRIPQGPWIVAGTLFLTGVAYLLQGEALFSPGPLREARTATSTPLGGVRSHADLADRCSACHAPSGGVVAMQSLCLDCHVDIRAQIDGRATLHGRFSNATNCLSCHTEHHGPTASLTDFTHFDHALTAFPLTGRHVQASCSACHRDRIYRGTPASCAACHAEPASHRGRFGTDCARCHNTLTWQGATITAELHRFPIRHGGGKNRGECATCHPTPSDYRSYTCYGCHRHDPEKTAEKHLRWNVVQLQACAKCHPTGRKRPDEPAKVKRDDD